MNPVSAYRQAARPRNEADRLVMQHAELVKRIAFHLAGRLPPSVEVDDLVQAGMLGLLEAASHYCDGRGASFETYAGIRIRGAMIDSLRKLDWAPRSVHRKARVLSQAIREIEAETGTAARDVEIAERAGMTLEEYHRSLQDSAVCQIAALDEDLAATQRDERADPFEETSEDRFRMALAAEITNLPERERMVMSLYYQQELNLKEIGAVLGVTESRVCQLHGQALARLRARLADWREADR